MKLNWRVVLPFMLAAVFVSSILSVFHNQLLLKTPLLPTIIKKNMSTNQMQMPPFMYGTAWKKEKTKELVELAVRSGFRGVDTACQPKHYHEPGVGEALQALFAENIITRGEIFLQTKFTSLNGQDPNRIPYNPKSTFDEQVRQSFDASLRNLRTDYVDSFVLHGPLHRFVDTMLVWRTMEELYDTGKVRQIGISNIYDISMLRQLYDEARVKPTVLQNRFYSDTGYDKEIREFCAQNNITYQSFWTLTANPHVLKAPLMQQLSRKYRHTPEQLFFSFVRSLGITPLTGSSSPVHLQQDLAALSLHMDTADLQALNELL